MFTDELGLSRDFRSSEQGFPSYPCKRPFGGGETLLAGTLHQFGHNGQRD